MKVKLVILFCLMGIVTGVQGQQGSIRYLAEHPEYPKYLEGVIVADIVYPGQDFNRLKVFGEPDRREYNSEGSYRTWLFYFDGFQLEFIDIYGEPELRELRISSPAVEFLYFGEEVSIGKSLAVIMDIASFEQIEKSETDQQKYRGRLLFLEVLVDGSGTILEIIYGRDPHL